MPEHYAFLCAVPSTPPGSNTPCSAAVTATKARKPTLRGPTQGAVQPVQRAGSLVSWRKVPLHARMRPVWRAACQTCLSQYNPHLNLPSHPPTTAKFCANAYRLPSPQFVDTLLIHLTTGFDIEYQGPHLDLPAPNLTSASQHPSAIDNYLHSECKQGRMAGPFNEPPFSPFHCSGMGVVPKQDGSWRVITHLSAPEGGSINDFIGPEAVTLKYTTVDNVIKLANQLGCGTLFAKIDLAKAFRQCPVRAADWHLLGLQWKGKLYYDKCLPFGPRSFPFLFNTVDLQP